MKNLKLFLVALVFSVSLVGMAKEKNYAHPGAVSVEIENLLKEKAYEGQKGISVTVFFSVSKDNRIQSLSVASPNEAVNQYLLKKLGNQKLEGDAWMSGKIYELTVTVN